MSIEAVAIALHHSQASGTAKLVLIGIANHDGDAGSFPKTATLARYANVHPRRISAAVAQLVALGEIEVDQKGGGKAMPNLRSEVAPNLYTITLDCPPNCDRTRRHQLLDDNGQALKFGRSYQGAYVEGREKDPEAVERGKRAWEKRQGFTVDNVPQRGAQDPQEPSVENSTSDENSTRSSVENSTTPSVENDTTKNHTLNHPENPALVPSVTSAGEPVEKSAHCETAGQSLCQHEQCQWAGCGCDCHGLRAIVPALPRAKPGTNDATRKKSNIDPLGLPEEQKSLNRRGAAMARAALRGELAITEAKDGSK